MVSLGQGLSVTTAPVAPIAPATTGSADLAAIAVAASQTAGATAGQTSGQTASQVTTTVVLTALETAVQAAASNQSGLAPLLSDLAAVLQSPNLPPSVQTAITQVLNFQLPIDPPPSAADLRQAIAQSGLFMEAQFATNAAPSAGDDLKAALLNLGQALESWNGAPTPAGAQASPLASAAPENTSPVQLAPAPGPAAASTPNLANPGSTAAQPASSAPVTQASAGPATAPAAPSTAATTIAPAIEISPDVLAGPAATSTAAPPPQTALAQGQVAIATTAPAAPNLSSAAPQTAPPVVAPQASPNASLVGNDVKAALQAIGQASEMSMEAPAGAATTAASSQTASAAGSAPTTVVTDQTAMAADQSDTSLSAATVANSAASEVGTPTSVVGQVATTDAGEPATPTTTTMSSAAPAAPQTVAVDTRPAITQASLFLEAQLASPVASSDGNSVRASLLALGQAIEAWTGSAPATTANTAAATSSAPAPPFKGGPVQGQPAVVADLSPESPAAMIASQLIKQTSGAISRQVLMQAASASRGGAANTAPSNGNQPAQWLFEIPLATPQGPSIAQFEVDRDGVAAGQDESQRTWRARFSLDVDPMGPVHAEIALGGGKAKVTLWAAKGETLARLSQNRGELSDALMGDDLEAQIAVFPGPPRTVAPSAGKFTDRAV